MKRYAILIILLLMSCTGTKSGEEKMTLNEQVNTKSDLYTEQELRKKLNPEQYRVVRENGTEPAFQNEYWDNKKPGIYVDIVSGEPLFSSTEKFDSGTGWPSFTIPLARKGTKYVKDRSFGMERVEVRSNSADSH